MGDPRGYFELGEFYKRKETDARADKKFQSAWEYEKKQMNTTKRQQN
ncbi:hypothetical protein [Helicobacter mehlei]|nr:hypothetical protein [Helicobacter mehlei]